MRCLRCVFAMTLILLLLISGGIETFAMNTGFATNELSEKDKIALLSNINISVLAEEPKRKPIYCFDVNQEGQIAIVCSSFEQKTICVYDDSCFLYGFVLNSSGSIGVEWNDKDINIYFIRSDVIVTVNPKGEIIEALQVQDTIENNSYRNHYIYATSRTVGDTRYSIRNDIGILNLFASSYSQITATNSDGKIIVMYDANSEQLTKTTAICILVFLLVLLSIGMMIRGIKGRLEGRENGFSAATKTESAIMGPMDDSSQGQGDNSPVSAETGSKDPE